MALSISEALTHADFASKDKWARPVSWKGLHIAITFDVHSEKDLVVVPSARGGLVWRATIDELADDWELVDPGVVLAGD